MIDTLILGVATVACTRFYISSEMERDGRIDRESRRLHHLVQGRGPGLRGQPLGLDVTCDVDTRVERVGKHREPEAASMGLRAERHDVLHELGGGVRAENMWSEAVNEGAVGCDRNKVRDRVGGDFVHLNRSRAGGPHAVEVAVRAIGGARKLISVVCSVRRTPITSRVRTIGDDRLSF